MKRTNGILAGIVVLLLTGCFNNDGNSKEAVAKNSEQLVNMEDVERFKTEFEEVNGAKSRSGKKTHISVSIPEDSRVIYVDEEDVLNLENGVVLFGFPTCPWCRNAVEPLLEFAREEKVDIHYLNISAIRDKKELKDGQVVTTEEGTSGYRAILEKFDAVLNPYPGLEDESIKRIVSPTVLFIEGGKGVSKVVGTVESQKDAYVKLTEEQHNELKQLYKDHFQKIENR